MEHRRPAGWLGAVPAPEIWAQMAAGRRQAGRRGRRRSVASIYARAEYRVNGQSPDTRQPFHALHLPEQMHVVAAHRQHFVAALEVNLRSFIVMPPHMANRAQVHDD